MDGIATTERRSCVEPEWLQTGHGAGRVSAQVDRRGVDAGAGERYQVKILLVHGWKDGFVPNGPAGYPRWWLAPLVFLRRARHVPWVGLIATVGRGDPYFIGEGAGVMPSKDGRLEFYANDVPFMYWNNSGHVDLEIEEIR